MTKQTPYMKSRFKRRKNDHYPTIDTRCVDALLHFVPHTNTEGIVDVCAPQGSAIIDYLKSLGISAWGIPDAFSNDGIDSAKSIVTNPPYDISVVDKIIYHQIERLKQPNGLEMVAMLLRTNFDHAIGRKEMFSENKYYWGQIKLCFRPWWTKSRRMPPFHNFVWHIWTHMPHYEKRVVYYYPPFDPQYQAKPKPKQKRSRRVTNKKKK